MALVLEGELVAYVVSEVSQRELRQHLTVLPSYARPQRLGRLERSSEA